MNVARPHAGIASRQGCQNQEAPVVVAYHGADAWLGSRLIWHELTMTVHAGEFIAVLGPNGAGKSTLLKLLLGLLQPRAGEVIVLGRPARRGNAAIGYVPQRRTFDAEVPIRGRDLVHLGLTGHRWGIPLLDLVRLWRGRGRTYEEWHRVQSMIDLVGAHDYADRPIGTLSGGEQQRLLIAQALVTQPRILLLDEPLEGLDLNHQQAVTEVIGRVCQNENIAVLLVSHDVNPLLPYVDRMLYLAHGQAALGAPGDVLTSETLSRLYGAPVDVLRTRDGRVVVGQSSACSEHPTNAH